ncbi:hypothetical protein ABZ769_28285 [Streptomyces olivoreticuli]
MHDPSLPPSRSPEPAPAGSAGAVSAEAAADLVEQVIALYGQQILAEHRSHAPDPERLKALKALKAQLVACAADQEALQDAAPGEVAEIAARYAALARELGDQ